MNPNLPNLNANLNVNEQSFQGSKGVQLSYAANKLINKTTTSYLLLNETVKENSLYDTGTSKLQSSFDKFGIGFLPLDEQVLFSSCFDIQNLLSSYKKDCDKQRFEILKSEFNDFISGLKKKNIGFLVKKYSYERQDKETDTFSYIAILREVAKTIDPSKSLLRYFNKYQLRLMVEQCGDIFKKDMLDCFVSEKLYDAIVKLIKEGKLKNPDKILSVLYSRELIHLAYYLHLQSAKKILKENGINSEQAEYIYVKDINMLIELGLFDTIIDNLINFNQITLNYFINVYIQNKNYGNQVKEMLLKLTDENYRTKNYDIIGKFSPLTVDTLLEIEKSDKEFDFFKPSVVVSLNSDARLRYLEKKFKDLSDINKGEVLEGFFKKRLFDEFFNDKKVTSSECVFESITLKKFITTDEIVRLDKDNHISDTEHLKYLNVDQLNCLAESENYKGRESVKQLLIEKKKCHGVKIFNDNDKFTDLRDKNQSLYNKLNKPFNRELNLSNKENAEKSKDKNKYKDYYDHFYD